MCHSRRSPKENRHLRRLLCQIGWAAARTKETFFAGLFARLSPKISGKGAAWAVAPRIAKVVWLMLHKGMEYKEHRTAVANPRTLRRKLSKFLREFYRAGIDAKSLFGTIYDRDSVGGFSRVPAPRR